MNRIRRCRRACFYCKSIKKKCITYIDMNDNERNNRCKRCFKRNITCTKKRPTEINLLDEIRALTNELINLKNSISKNI